MNDRGEKIVNLAREILQTTPSIEVKANANSSKTSVSVKTVYFAAILAAIGGSFVTQWFSETCRPITYYEKVELNALMFYAAKTNKLDETKLRNDVKSSLKLKSLEDLTAFDYRRAKKLLLTKIQ